MPETKTNAFSAKDLATECGTDAKSVRKFLREFYRSNERADDLPGQGGRYTFTKKEINSLVKAYKEWATGKAAKKAASAEKPARSKKEQEIEDLTDEEVEDFDVDEEPSAEDLQEDLEIEDLDEEELEA